MSEETKAEQHPFESVTLLPPKPGVCPICADNHKPEYPHNKNSIYYQMRFRQDHGRFPKWSDAMAHCTQEIKDLFVGECKKRGIDIEAIDADDGMDWGTGTVSDR